MEEQRLRLDGITWHEYDALMNLFINRFPSLRMSYLEGRLELSTPSLEHERLSKLISRLIETFAEEADIDLEGYGSATFRKEAKARGLEPDECYCFGQLADVPDIAIEIVITSGSVDKLEIYRGLGVPEVWFWENQTFSLYHLDSDTEHYREVTHSQLLPGLELSLLTQFIGYPTQTQAVKAYRKALRSA